jgi:hypothetical protein
MPDVGTCQGHKIEKDSARKAGRRIREFTGVVELVREIRIVGIRGASYWSAEKSR